MSIEALIKNTESELTHGEEPAGEIILSSRIRLARNLNNYPFPGWAKVSMRMEIMEKCFSALYKLPEMKGHTALKMSELNELERQVLVERHLMSKELSNTGEGGAVVINKDQSCAVMVNEEDHLRIQVLRRGFRLKDIWTVINNLDTGLEAEIDYAFSPELGYLTACPTNVGTGMRASVMLHLSGLVLIEHMDKVIRAVNQLGLAVRGVSGEGSEASGSVFQISNQQTLGESEEDIIRRLVNVLKTLIQHEQNARQKLMETCPRKIMDKVGRAYGTLMNAHVLSSAESMNLLSLIRLGVDLDMLPEAERGLVDRLFIESQPGHIQYMVNKSAPADERDAMRADYLRENLSRMPLLDFEHCQKRINN